jgi:hypothetical protein
MGAVPGASQGARRLSVGSRRVTRPAGLLPGSHEIMYGRAVRAFAADPLRLSTQPHRRRAANLGGSSGAWFSGRPFFELSDRWKRQSAKVAICRLILRVTRDVPLPICPSNYPYCLDPARRRCRNCGRTGRSRCQIGHPPRRSRAPPPSATRFHVDPTDLGNDDAVPDLRARPIGRIAGSASRIDDEARTTIVSRAISDRSAGRQCRSMPNTDA